MRKSQKIKQFELNKNESTAYKNLWDAAEVVVQREMFSVTECLHLKKKKFLKVRNPSFHLKKIENEGQTKSKANRRKENVKLKPEIKDNREINEIKRSFEKIDKIG